MKDSFLMGYLYPKYKFYNPNLIILSALLSFLLITLSNISGFAQDIVEQGQNTRKTLTVTGIVVSAIDGKPIEGVDVSLAAARSGVLTDKNGYFAITTNRINGGFLIAKLLGYDDKMISFTNNLKPLQIVMNPINDPFRDRYPDFEALKIGEKVPDIEFAIKNYHSPTAKISDFKGKLLIFDFWSTYCAPCIGSLPQMEQLQKQFGDKIQIILVNVRENEEEVGSRLKKINIPHQQIHTMPSIISNKALNQLFPHEFAGNYIWIDKEGILRLNSGQSYNNHEEKINEVLDGKTISFVKTDRSYPQDKRPLSEIINESSDKKAEYSSIFTSVDYNYLPTGGQELESIDPKFKTLRNTYINRTVIELYNYALGETLKEDWKSKVYGPNLSGNYLDYFLIKVKDSILYDCRLIPDNEITDINMVKSMFCYENIFPLKIGPEQSREYMRKDLDRFFGLKYGTKVDIEEVILSCYMIKRNEGHLFSEEGIKKELKHLGNREYISLGDLGSVVNRFYRTTTQGSKGSVLPYVFDVEEVNKKGKFIMPVWEKGDKLEDFIKALKTNGVDYIKGEKKIKMIVVRDNQ